MNPGTRKSPGPAPERSYIHSKPLQSRIVIFVVFFSSKSSADQSAKCSCLPEYQSREKFLLLGSFDTRDSRYLSSLPPTVSTSSLQCNLSYLDTKLSRWASTLFPPPYPKCCRLGLGKKAPVEPHWTVPNDIVGQQ